MMTDGGEPRGGFAAAQSFQDVRRNATATGDSGASREHQLMWAQAQWSARSGRPLLDRTACRGPGVFPELAQPVVAATDELAGHR